MSTKVTLKNGNRIVESLQDLESFFRGGITPENERRIGIEFEALGVMRDTLRAIGYTEHILPIFEYLMNTHGYAPIIEGGNTIGLEKDEKVIALEPGGQLELSGSPFKTLMECQREYEEFLGELSGHPLGDRVGFLGLGLQPFSPNRAIEMVPKPRYGIMAPYLRKRGERALDMMKRTATIQVNLDYTSIEDLLRKVRLAFYLTPIYQAMFANSPIALGRLNGYQTQRASIWQDTDPDRCGLVATLMHNNATLSDYLEYVLGIPLILLEDEGELHETPPVPFGRFLQEGIGSRRATLSDFILHLSLVFPEVRIKTFFEVRGADSLPRPLVFAPAALLVGILYDEQASLEAEGLLKGLPKEGVFSLYSSVPRLGYKAGIDKMGSVFDWALGLVKIAKGGLIRRGYGEEGFLEGLIEPLAEGKNPALVLRERFLASGKNLGEALKPFFLT